MGRCAELEERARAELRCAPGELEARAADLNKELGRLERKAAKKAEWLRSGSR